MSIHFHNYNSASISEKYDPIKGLTEIHEIYNDNGKEHTFSEIIKGHPHSFDLNERLKNDFLSSPFHEIKYKTFFNNSEMINRKFFKKKNTIKRKRKRKTSRK
jgi:hypothetical protein